jgi:3-oxoacyl-[acyl-carrier protein] reductase
MQTLIVTGASRGLGAFICEAAQSAGYRVIGVARQAATDRSYEIRGCDISDPEQVKSLFQQLKPEPDLYGLINAAGIASMNLIVSTPSETMQRIVAVNLLGAMYCTAAMGRLLARRKTGRIINFSTIAVEIGLKGEGAYVASKSGVEGLTRVFAKEMADFGVTVNAVAPGPIATDLIRNVPEEKIKHIVDMQAIRRPGTPEDVWNVVSLLLDNRAAMITGEVIHLGGV